jgi:DNA polymerase
MQHVYWDVETFSQVNLKDRGAHIYASDETTGVFFFCHAVDDGEVRTWYPGDPVPAPFANPPGFLIVSDNFSFERSIHENILVRRYGFPPIPLENTDCAERRALAASYPAELGLRCEALGLRFRKNPEARKAMMRLARPQTKKKQSAKPEDPTQRERDLMLLLERCKSDVEATRACYNHPRLPPLLPEERALLLLDARINARGIAANIPFLEAARMLAVNERNAINTRLGHLTAGVITSVDQVQKIREAVNARGQDLETLGKRSVAAALAGQPEGFARKLLILRQHGAFASTRKYNKLLEVANPVDHRIRDALRIYGAGPGRWSSVGTGQLQNLARNDRELPASLIGAVIAGNRNELARWGNPLQVVSGISRAALCAAAGHHLVCVDFAAIESRVLAWLAGETWKLDAYRQFDKTGDKNIEVYRIVAARMLNKSIEAISAADRQKGKATDLACGFGGSVGALRRIVGDDGRSDEVLQSDVNLWRTAHPATRKLGRELAKAIRVAIRVGQNRPILVADAPRPPLVVAFDGHTLTMTLPSGRAIHFPGARLVSNAKFEDGEADVEFFDNAKRQWKRVRAWYGTFLENAVQGIARDLLAAALLRAEARGWSTVFHCHDELVIEAPEGTLPNDEVLAMLKEPPAWAIGLPFNGKVHRGPTYLEAPATGEPPEPETKQELVEHAVDAFVAMTPPNPNIAKAADGDFLASLTDTVAPLYDFVSLPMTASQHVSCPFHDDPQPSCKIYSDHWHCFGCGRRGTRLDWPCEVEGMTKREAIDALQDWSGPGLREQRNDTAARIALALQFWREAGSLAGTLGARYLVETRGIDITKLSPTIHEVLRFHSSCIFGSRARHPCIVALMRDPVTDAPTGIHRIGLDPTGKKLDRMALGRRGVVKLWPVDGERLVVGEGIETVLAAATRITYRDAMLTPAWAAVNEAGIAGLPVLPGIAQLTLLVDNDANGVRQKAAGNCKRVWTAAGRKVVTLIPKQEGWDFNDVILQQSAA